MPEARLKRALSIRQPYAEQILRGTKKIEYRSQPTRIRERVYIYASQTPGAIEDFAAMQLRPDELPTGVLVGTVEIYDCTGHRGDYEWHLTCPRRLDQPAKPENHPLPAWFFPFKEA
jgi:hypothetical protein